MNILITGADGFIGRSIRAALSLNAEYTLYSIDVGSSEDELKSAVAEADFVMHLAGVNRPKTEDEFMTGNADLTHRLTEMLKAAKKPPMLITSSTQAALENPYGQSKRAAEEAVFAYGRETGAPVYVYRLTNAFGKWSRPNYNSAVATFCHNIARGLPITVNNRDALLKLVYIDDIIDEFTRAIAGEPTRNGDYCFAGPEHEITVGGLAELLQGFRAARDGLNVIDQTDPLTRMLFATYLSFLPPDDFSRSPVVHSDARGSFTELLHMGGYGQVSVNVSKPHITKGEHWHHTKHEKFCVLSGTGVIRFRSVYDSTVISYKVSGDVPQIVDIPTGYTHNIENTGDTDMITLMWANEYFDPAKPDTYRLDVEENRSK